MLLSRKSCYLLAVLLFPLVYLPVFFTDYAFMDEIHQLWNNRDRTNLNLFLTQGRWLTGLLMQHLFGSISDIASIKYLRILSLIGWIGTTLLWVRLFDSWRESFALDRRLLPLSVVFIAACPPVAVYIGWASCLQLFLGTAAGLLSGHLAYSAFGRKSGNHLAGSLALGVASLFLYQTAFGIFLLPFLLRFWKAKTARPDRLVMTGIFIYLLTYGIYFLLFRHTLAAYGVAASNRTEIRPDLLQKLGFFFSGPLPQAFTLNWLYAASSLFAQALYMVVMLLWAVGIFRRNRDAGAGKNLLFLLATVGMLALVYLPLLIAKEDFASYRTAFAINLAVFLMLADLGLHFMRHENGKKHLAIALSLLLIAIGSFNFSFQFALPLGREYKALRQFIAGHDPAGLRQVYFIRADKHLFQYPFGARVYRDEFGQPSTNKDWVPESIIRQIVTELTGSRQKGESVQVIQFENLDSFSQARVRYGPGIFLADMNAIYRTY